MSNSYRGSIVLILGCMYSGKTSTLINQYNRHSIGGKKCIMIKHKIDTRYSETETVTHDGIKIESYVCSDLKDADELIKNYDAIFIDEIQFYQDGSVLCDSWANNGKLVYACGLNGTYERKQFKVISELIPIVENIIYLTAVDSKTGSDAVYSKRLTCDTQEQLIGGSDIYQAVSRYSYFN